MANNQKRVLIGLGMTGLSCARYFSSRQHSFSVVDSRENPPGLRDFISEFPDVEMHLGEISDSALHGAGQIVVSPGVALEEPAIARAINSGVEVCGDIDLFRSEALAPLIAITGSNGKSTVTTLVGEMVARADKKVAVGGNIGIPALDLLKEEIPDFYVLELSSFQLERSRPLMAEVAVILNIVADHMDRYTDIHAYQNAKHKIFQGCRQVVINRNDELTRPILKEDVKEWTFGLDGSGLNGFGVVNKDGIEYLAFESEALMPVTSLKMAGRHNIENALAALAIGHAVGLSFSPMLDVLAEFKGLPHRCQYVAELNSVRFYNDSKGTNVGATVAAIAGFESSSSKVVLIAGGEGKGADFSPLLPVVKKYCRAVVLLGEAAGELAQLLSNEVIVKLAGNMIEAVTIASGVAVADDVVLLSPACASFDMFENYQHRGNVFIEAVQGMTGGVH